MTRFTVTYTDRAVGELAKLWLTARDKLRVTESADAIEKDLRFDADIKGKHVQDRLRKLKLEPLVFYYLVSPDDRLVTIWSVRIAKP